MPTTQLSIVYHTVDRIPGHSAIYGNELADQKSNEEAKSKWQNNSSKLNISYWCLLRKQQNNHGNESGTKTVLEHILTNIFLL